MNPSRKCGMCDTMGEEQQPMAELLAILPDPSPFWIEDELGLTFRSTSTIDEAIDKLRNITGNCPACILAALRQKCIPIPATKFNFTEECESFWDKVNVSNQQY